jgi:hypothetical protein
VRRAYWNVPDVVRPLVVREYRRNYIICTAGTLFRDICRGEAYVGVRSARGDSDGWWSKNLVIANKVVDNAKTATKAGISRTPQTTAVEPLRRLS